MLWYEWMCLVYVGVIWFVFLIFGSCFEMQGGFFVVYLQFEVMCLCQVCQYDIVLCGEDLQWICVWKGDLFDLYLLQLFFVYGYFDVVLVDFLVLQMFYMCDVVDFLYGLYQLILFYYLYFLMLIVFFFGVVFGYQFLCIVCNQFVLCSFSFLFIYSFVQFCVVLQIWYYFVWNL